MFGLPFEIPDRVVTSAGACLRVDGIEMPYGGADEDRFMPVPGLVDRDSLSLGSPRFVVLVGRLFSLLPAYETIQVAFKYGPLEWLCFTFSLKRSGSYLMLDSFCLRLFGTWKTIPFPGWTLTFIGRLSNFRPRIFLIMSCVNLLSASFAVYSFLKQSTNTSMFYFCYFF